MACECFILLRKDSQAGIGYTRGNYRVILANCQVPGTEPFSSDTQGGRHGGIDTRPRRGPNSIGWALTDEVGQEIAAAGVRAFAEGVDRDQQGGEKSKTQSRRDARGIRRQIRRRARRRRLLRQALATPACFQATTLRSATCWALDPYELRHRALAEKLTLHEVGRLLLHLAQRRGFLSNRKTDKATDNDTKGMLAEMNELAGAIDRADAPTLGSYLARLDGDSDRCQQTAGPHIRRRHTRRSMYEDEFEKAWAAQQEHYPQILTDLLRYGVQGKQAFRKSRTAPKRTSLLAEYGFYGLIFFQRKIYCAAVRGGPLRVGAARKAMSPRARIAQRFRIFQEVNNLRLLDRATRLERRLDPAERETVVRRLTETKEATFDQIRKCLEFPETVSFNFERGGRKKLDGHLSDALLGGKKCLGKRWAELPETVKDAVVDILIKEDNGGRAFAGSWRECGLSPEEAELAAAAHLPEGYMNFSRERSKSSCRTSKRA